ncbi:TPA: hypothetical protein ACHT7L_003750, partial [Klebsiella quasipneumoniae]
QNLKAAVEKWQEAWGKYDKVEITIAEFIRAANQYESIVKDPANVIELVEALEKAQQLNATQCQYFEGVIADGSKRIAELDTALEREREKSRRVMSRIAELEEPKEKRLPEPYAYLRENDGQIQISIGAERPSDRSGGYATPWFAIYTAAGIKVEAE